MMESKQFLGSVLADQGYIVVATPITVPHLSKTVWRNRAHPDIDAAMAEATQWLWEKRDVYFALGRYAKPRVWNALKPDPVTGKPGKWEIRTQANVSSMRAFYLDVDIKSDGKHYTSGQLAMQALRELCTRVELPKPTIVSSGYGFHIYWTFTESVTREDWKPAAEMLKSACVAEGLLADHGVTADEARVLRLPGSANLKRNGVRPVKVLAVGQPTLFGALVRKLSEYVSAGSVPVRSGRVAVPKVADGVPEHIARATVAGNITATNDPVNAGAVAFSCRAFAKQVISRGAGASEPMWRAALGVALFCEPQREAMLAVSDGHAEFNEAAMNAKVQNWTGGPSLCSTFWAQDSKTCESCPHYNKIKSPAKLGRMIVEATSPVVTVVETADGAVEEKIVSPPHPYIRRKRAVKTKDESPIEIVMGRAGDEGEETFTPVFPYDFYPVRVLRQTGRDSAISEKSVWRIVLPRLGPVDLSIPQSLLSDQRKLHALLLEEGAHINPDHAKAVQYYMSAYLQKLTTERDRERVYDRMGWHDDHRTFVMAEQTFHRDGTVHKHNPSQSLRAITKGAMHRNGVVEQWVDAMKFYAGPGNENYRFFLYCSLGAPLFHMTGHKGVLVAASGDSGRGKSTVLEGCASMWGDPEPLLISGGQDGTTINAFYSMLGANHSLPVFWDDTTERDATEMRKFLINISQGKGKERMKGNEHDARVVTWETMVLSSANTDDVSRILASGKDSEPHLMRMVSVEFTKLDRGTETKIAADEFKRRIRQHFGHAGPIMMEYVAANYDRVREAVIHTANDFDRMMGVESHERFWSATIASAYTAAKIAYKLGLLPFNPADDLQWLSTHVSRMRNSHRRASPTPVDVLGEFLEANVGHTLILAAKSSSNIDNIAQAPRGALYIRHEVDAQTIYVARAAVMQYCAECHANFRKLEDALYQAGVVTVRNCHKVLGADTPFAKGQTRCWKISATALENAR